MPLCGAMPNGQKKGLYSLNCMHLLKIWMNRFNGWLNLAPVNPEAMAEMKKMFWQGTETLGPTVAGKAAISGKLVVSAFTRNAIEKFKTKTK